MPRYRNLALPCIGIEEDLFCRNETDFLILNYVFAPSCPPSPMCFLRAYLRLSRSEGFPSGHHVFFSHFCGLRGALPIMPCHLVGYAAEFFGLFYFPMFKLSNFKMNHTSGWTGTVQTAIPSIGLI